MFHVKKARERLNAVTFHKRPVYIFFCKNHMTWYIKWTKVGRWFIIPLLAMGVMQSAIVIKILLELGFA